MTCVIVTSISVISVKVNKETRILRLVYWEKDRTKRVEYESFENLFLFGGVDLCKIMNLIKKESYVVSLHGRQSLNGVNNESFRVTVL